MSIGLNGKKNVRFQPQVNGMQIKCIKKHAVSRICEIIAILRKHEHECETPL